MGLNMEFGKKRVLLADDAGSMRALVKSSLRELGIELFAEAANGAQALEHLRGSTFDLVICDWDMPEVDGLGVLQAVRADDRVRTIPFLMLTANASRDHVEDAIAAGVDDYVAKPFQTNVLNYKVVKLLAR